MNFLKQMENDIRYEIGIRNQKTLYGESEMRGMVPIYVILTSGSSVVSKAIMNVTKSKYSHCTMALVYYETVSMGTTAKNYGIAVESIFEFPDRHRDGNMKICRRYVPEAVFEKMYRKIYKYKREWKKIGYSFSKMTNFFRWIPKKKISSYRDETSFICSEFVALILSNIDDFNNTIKKSDITKDRASKYLLSPREIEQTIMNTFETIYEGPIGTISTTFLYDIDKKYVSTKSRIIKAIENKFSKTSNIEMNRKIALSDNHLSMMNSELSLEALRKYCTDKELEDYLSYISNF